MRKLIPLLLLPVMISSCSMINYTPHVEPEPPYVLLKNGKKIEGDFVSKKERFFAKDKIVIDGKEYKTKDVALYSTGKDVYANMGKKLFAEKVMGEDIKVYRRVDLYNNYNSTTGASSTHSRIREYVQMPNKGNSVVLKTFNYKNVKDMIPPNSAAGQQLKDFHTMSTVGKIAYYTGLAAFVAGAAITFTSDPLGSGPGVPVAITGAGLFLGGGTVNILARPKLYKAVDAHNIADAKKRKQ